MILLEAAICGAVELYCVISVFVRDVSHLKCALVDINWVEKI